MSTPTSFITIRFPLYLCLVMVGIGISHFPAYSQSSIQVSPDSLAFAVPYGGSSSGSLSITNTSSDTRSINLAIKRPAGAVVSKSDQHRVGFRLDPSSKATTDILNGIRVLIAAADGASNISAHLLTYQEISDVGYFDTRNATPTIQQLQDYDVVLTWPNWDHSDPVALGDVLADYVDGGGAVVTGVFSFYTSSGFGLRGRIVSEGRTPLRSLDQGNHFTTAQLGSYDASHPIMEGVAPTTSDYYRDRVALESEAELVATWSDEEECVAVKGRIISINSYFGNDATYSGDIGRIIYNSIRYLANPRWLTVEPASGILSPAENMKVSVSVDASRVYGGEYHADLHITSTAGESSDLVIVPVRLNVAGNPILVLSDDSLKFREYFLGYPDTAIVSVSNAGTDSLRITSITTSGDFSVLNSSPIVIRVGGMHQFQIIYKRTSIGHATGSVLLQSNDTTSSSVAVHLVGSAIHPPAVATDPDSLSYALSVGDSGTASLTIQNVGLSTLHWSIANFAIRESQSTILGIVENLNRSYVRSVESRQALSRARSSSNLHEVRQSVASVTFSSPPIPGRRSVAIIATDGDSYLEDVQSKLISTARFNSVTTIKAGYTTPSLSDLLAFDAVLVWSNGSFQNQNLMGNVLADYVDLGGGVVTAVHAGLPGSWQIGGRFRSEEYWVITPSDVTSYYATLGSVPDLFHPLVRGVAELDGGFYSFRYTGSVVPGARRVADWSDGTVLIAERSMGGVDRVDLGMYPPSATVGWGLWEASTDGATIMANALSYVGRNFLSASPTIGSVDPGSSHQITVGASARNLIGGNYRDDLLISSNDPASPILAVPIRLQVTGVPKLATSSDTLDFGQGFLGYPDTLSLTILNTGTDSLRITSISTSAPAFSVLDAPAFALAVNGRKSIRIRYDRGSLEEITTTLEIVSNDPDNPSKSIALSGITVNPPIVDVAPSLIPKVSLMSGDTTTRTVTIGNLGASTLNFSTSVRPSSGLQSIRRQSSSDGAGVSFGKTTALPASVLLISDTSRSKKSEQEDVSIPFSHQPRSAGMGIDLPVTLFDVLGYKWDLRTNGSIDDGSNDAYDGGMRLEGFPGFATAETEEEGREIVIGPGTLQGVEVVRKIFVPSNAAFIRYLEIVSNPTSENRTVSIVIYTNLGSDGNEEFGLTSSGDDVFTVADRWIVTDDEPNIGDPAVVHVISGDGGVITPISVSGGQFLGFVSYEYTVTLGPGQKAIILHFGAQRVNGSQGVQAAEELVNLRGESLTGVSLEELSLVRNFAPPYTFRASPSSGSVDPSATQPITVSYDARGVVTGSYSALVRIESNDPVTGVVDVPVSLSVQGFPILKTSGDSLSFGEGFRGYPDTLSLALQNIGTDTLRVSGITLAGTEFSVLGLDSFHLPVGHARSVPIRYNRLVAGTAVETLFVHSNDPERSVKSILLLGSAVEPPEMVVNPDSITVGLAAGDSTTASLTIANPGLGILHWDIPTAFVSGHPGGSLEAVADQMRRAASMDAMLSKEPILGSAGRRKLGLNESEGVELMHAAGSPASVIDVLLIGADDVANRNDVQTKLLATGSFASVTSIDATSITPTIEQLRTYDAVLVWGNYPFQDPTVLGNVLAQYVDEGGGVVCAVFAGLPGYISGRFSTQNYWAMSAQWYTLGTSGIGMIHKPEHPVMTGVTAFQGGSGSYRYQGTEMSTGSVRIADWADGTPLIVERIINGVNRIDLGFYPPSSSLGSDYWDQATDGAKIMANALKYVAHRFVTVSPTSGTLAGGGSEQVGVSISARQLVAGLHRTTLTIRSNDPANPSHVIPIRAFVSGAPVIHLDVDSLDFGTGFQGFPALLRLEISNQGTDTLRITNAQISGSSEFEVLDPLPLSLPIAGRIFLSVRLIRSNIGLHKATLSIESNDPVNSTISVHLRGMTIDPPDIIIEPDSMGFSLSVGDSITSSFTIRNDGLSPLHWQATVRAKNSLGLLGIGSTVRELRGVESRPAKSSPQVPRFDTEVNDSGPVDEIASVTVTSGGVGRPNIALLAADIFGRAQEVRERLLVTGRFQSITVIDGQSVIPSLSQLRAFDAVLIWSNYGFLHSDSIGNVLADYVDAGGGVVTAVFAASSGFIQGRFTSENYWAVEPWYATSGGSHSLGTIHHQNHPVLRGVNSFKGGESSYRYTGTIAAGASRIADWTDGLPLIVEKTIRGVHRVDLGFYPPSSASYSTFWDTATGGTRIMANALLYVGRRFVSLASDSGIVAPGTSQDIDIGISTRNSVGGVFRNIVHVESNDPHEPTSDLIIDLRIAGNPSISVDSSLQFGDGFVSEIDTMRIRIHNSGTDLLTISDITTIHPEFSIVGPTSVSVPVYQFYDIAIRYARSSLGSHKGEMVITSDDPLRPSAVVLIGGSVSASPSNAGQALRMDGISQYAEILYESSKPLFKLAGSFTFEAWINPRGTGTIIGRQQCGVAWPSTELSIGGEAPTYDLTFILNNSNGFYYTTFTASGVLPKDVWSHVAATYDQSRQRVELYVDGILVLSSSYFGEVWQPPTSFWIMGIPAPTAECWSGATPGDVDEVRIWNRARSQAEIRQKMHRSVSAAEKFLVGCWRFDEGSETVSADISGDGNTARLRVGAGWTPSAAAINNPSIQFVPGRVLVVADGATTSDIGFANAAGGSAGHFVRNMATFFTGGGPGRFLVYSNSPVFGNQFRSTLTNVGHTVDVSITPGALGAYTAVFAGGYLGLNRDSLFEYVRRGGNLVIVSGDQPGSSEEGYWDTLTARFAIRLSAERGIAARSDSIYNVHQLFANVRRLYFDDPSTMRLLPGYLARTQILAWRGNNRYIALYDGRVSGLLPPQGELSHPPDGSGFTATTQDLYWNSVTDATSYRVEVSSTPDFSLIFADTIVQGNTTLRVSRLGRNTTYSWRVHPRNGSGFGKASLVWTFRTIPDRPPDTPTLVGPIDGSVNIARTVLLVWRKTQDASSYDLQLSTDSTFTSNVNLYGGITDTNSMSPVLATGTRYYWRVRGANLNGSGDWSGVWRFTTRVMPDLEVTTVQLPPSVFSGQSYQLSWTVRNRGDGITATPSWVDQVYLSADSSYNPQVLTYLGQFENPTYLNPGESYTQTGNFTLPRGIFGDYYVFVITDAHNAVTEQNELNNVGRNAAVMRVTLSPYAELQVVSVVVPQKAFSDDTITVSWTTKNFGLAPTPATLWYDVLYLSRDSVLDFDTDLHLLTVPRHGVLAPESSYSRTVFVRLPHGVFGRHYIFVAADRFNSVYEFVFDDNNNRMSDSINIRLAPAPDLVVTSVEIPADGFSGKQINVKWTVLNEGAGATFSHVWSDRVYLSKSPTFLPESSQVLGTLDVRMRLYPDSSYSRSVWLTLPNGISGVHYVYVTTDWNNREFEYLAEDNNTRRSASPIAITVSPWPNLTVRRVEIPDSAAAGQLIRIRWLVANTGNDTSRHRSDRLHYSTSPTFDEQAVVLRDVHYAPSIVPGQVDTQEVAVRLPVSLSGNYFVYVQTDYTDRVYEHTDEGDNVGRSIQPMVVRPHPPVDLAVLEFTAPADGSSGESVEISWRVGNIGAARTVSNAWYDELYLSADSFLTPGVDRRLGQYYRLGQVESGESYSRIVRVQLPNGIAGPHYLMVWNNNSSEAYESDRTNNVRFSPIAITLTPSPDLRIDSLSVPDAVTAGQPFTARWTVRNAGTGPTRPRLWYDALYISRDQTISADDVRLTIRGRSVDLMTDSSYTVDQEMDMPPFLSGSYYLIAVTDVRNDIYEHLAEDNNTAIRAIRVDLAPLSDLIVTDISMPDSATPGERIVVEYMLANIGVNRATGWLRDIVYFSSDSIWSPDDLPLGVNFRFISLARGASVRVRTSIDLNEVLELDSLDRVVGRLPGLSPGWYRAIVRVDTRNNIRESDKMNNTRASTDSLIVRIPLLALGKAVNDSLALTRPVYYRIDAPTGSALRVILVSESPVGSNEIYIRRGAVPSISNFDVAGNEPFSVNQTVTIPFVQDGSYYLLARTRSAIAQSILLLADTLAFQIGSVVPSKAGNAGPVTLKIGGARFEPWTSTILRPAGVVDTTQDIVPTWSTRTDAGLIYATFDLTDVSPGPFDVIVRADHPFFDADSTTFEWRNFGVRYESTLPAAFEVVDGSAGRLEAKLHLPASARRGTDFTTILEVKNTGLTDIPAPLLYVSSPNGTPISLRRPVPVDAGSEIQLLVLGVEGRRDVLAPGQQLFIPIYARADQLPSSKLSLRNYSRLDIPLEWDEIELHYRDESPEEEWRSVWHAFKSMVGPTWRSFHEAMRSAAVRKKPTASDRYYDGSELILQLLSEARRTALSSFAFSSPAVPAAIIPTIEGMRTGTFTFDRAASRPVVQSLLPPNFGCDTCVTDPIIGATYQTQGMLAAQTFSLLTRPYAGFALTHFLWGSGSTIHFINSPSSSWLTNIATDMEQDEHFDAWWRRGFMQLLDSRSRVRGRELHCGEEISTTVQDLFAELPGSFLSPSFNFNNDGSIGLRLTIGAIPGNGVPPSSVTGNVTIKRHCQRDCNGNVTSHYIRAKSDVRLHIEDMYDFCPGSQGNVETTLSGFVIYIIQQLETCGYAREFIISLDIDLPRDVTFNVPLPDGSQSNPPQPPSPSCSGGGNSCGGNSPPGGPGCDDNNNPDDDGDGPDDGGDPDDGGNDDGDVPTVASQDPNDITGPRGAGDQRWVTVTETMPYLIRFENDPVFATAPAQVVNITLPLDPDADPRTFRLGEFGFGSHTFSDAIGKAAFSKRLDVRDSLGIYVDVNAGIDITTGTAFWSFRSIDPLTGEAPSDPMAGFLPVNDSSHRGEGFANFTIRPRKSASTGDSIIAQADIIFDDNGIIQTPPTFNTLDAKAPVSAVHPSLPVVDSTGLWVSWSGSDDSSGSGIASYTVYVSKNNGPFVTWLSNVTDTAAIFRGDRDSIYSFFTIARDSAGNTEPMKTQGDASGIITGIGTDRGVVELPKEYQLRQNYPNPFNPITDISYALPVPSRVRLVVYDVLGRVVETLVDEVQPAGYKTIGWNAQSRASGVYFYRLEAIGIADPSRTFTQVRKMVLMR